MRLLVSGGRRDPTTHFTDGAETPHTAAVPERGLPAPAVADCHPGYSGGPAPPSVRHLSRPGRLHRCRPTGKINRLIDSLIHLIITIFYLSVKHLQLPNGNFNIFFFFKLLNKC